MNSEKYFLWFTFNKRIRSGNGRQIMLGHQPLPWMPIRMSVTSQEVLKSRTDKSRWKRNWLRKEPLEAPPKVHILKSDMSLEEATALFHSLQVHPEMHNIQDIDPTLNRSPEFVVV